MNHEIYMRRCFELARNGEGYVAPNPQVGAVLVHNEKIISEGYHQKFGADHAEVNALKNIGDKNILNNSTLYVNLEPCSHFGKTPPCADLIINKGIQTVVISNTDPNPAVNGKGIKKLLSAGIEVITGICEEDGMKLNKRFFTFHQQKRPFIILKWAQSVNGFIAPENNQGEIFWISNKTSQLLVHKWRGEEQGILVGSNTVKLDNPRLTTRHFNGKNPVRIILDPELILKKDYHIFDDQAPTIIFNTIANSSKHNVTFVKINSGKKFLLQVLNHLYEKNIQSVLVEGGHATLTSFINEDLWDEARVFTGGMEILKGTKSPEIKTEPVQQINIDGDKLNIYRNRHIS